MGARVLVAELVCSARIHSCGKNVHFQQTHLYFATHTTMLDLLPLIITVSSNPFGSKGPVVPFIVGYAFISDEENQLFFMLVRFSEIKHS